MKPILFSSPMIQAILAGRKTQTRMVIKFPKDYTGGPVWPNGQLGIKYESQVMFPLITTERLFPRYEVGDILYVRETWRLVSWNWDDSEATIEFKDGEKVCFELDGDDQYQWLFDQVEKLIRLEIYVATDEDSEQMDWSGKPNPWNSPIHLPKYCSRIFLQVTDVRAERLQDISPEDSIAEGVEYWNIDPESLEGGELVADFKNYTWTQKREDDPNYEDRYFPSFANSVDSFRTLWDSINAKKCPWDSNPWVWVYSFKKIDKP